MLEMSGATVRLGGRTFAFDLQVDSSGWIAIVGPSGAGKSTLLNLIGGFTPLEAGHIRFDGADIGALSPAERPVTTLFQDHNLFVHLTVEQNVALGVDPGLRLDAEGRARVAAALDEVGLAARADAQPGALSGGERQRIGLARALVRRKPLLLLDEPLSQLDPATRIDVLDRIAALHREHGTTIVMVLHTPHDALGHVDRYVFVEDGRISAEFSPDQLRGGAIPAPVRAYLGELPAEPRAAG